MKISTKGEYGFRAMLFISMRGEGGPVTSSEIAQRQAIPERRIEIPLDLPRCTTNRE